MSTSDAHRAYHEGAGQARTESAVEAGLHDFIQAFDETLNTFATSEAKEIAASREQGYQDEKNS